MQEENIRLIDEALEHEPIRNTFRLSWEFIQLNKKFTLISMGIFFVLNFLAASPFLGTLFILFAGVFGILIQIHAGKIFYSTQNIDTYINEIQKSKIDVVVKKHLQTAFGAYLAWIVLLFLVLVVLGIVGSSTGILHEGMNQMDLVVALERLGLPVLLLVLCLFYVQPLVQSNIILARDFKEGFKAVFSIFSVDVWRSAFNKSYFNYVVLFGLVLIAVLFALVAFIMVFIMIPFMNIFVSLLALSTTYIGMVVISIASMMARRLVEK